MALLEEGAHAPERRAMPSSLMLSAGRSLFETNAGEQKTYQLSKPGECQVFLSHTWRSAGWAKYLTLLYVFNGRLALLVGHAAGLSALACCLALRASGVQMPVYYVPLPPNDALPVGPPQAFVCTFVASIAMCVTLFFGHYLQRDTPVFLDKCCITQGDQEIMATEIRGLDKILRRCHTMLLLWDHDYLERLWCVYEVAAFTHPGVAKTYQDGSRRLSRDEVIQAIITAKLEDRMVHVVPISLGVFAVCMVGIVSVGCMFLTVLLDFNSRYAHFPVSRPFYWCFWTIVGTAVWWVPKYYFCQKSVQARREMVAQLRGFSVADAKVFDPKDRAFIEDNVRRWFGSLADFDAVVRTALPGVFDTALGTEAQVVPYSALLFENAPGFFWIFYDGLAASGSLEAAGKVILLGLGEHFVCNPLFIYALTTLARVSLDLPVPFAAALRAVFVPLLGCWWPALFAFVWLWPLTTSVPALVGAGILTRIAYFRGEAARKAGERGPGPDPGPGYEKVPEA